ncbi:MATE family efflux transporter [Actinocrinis puniceicyclus]|uniref:MATE family efflux transporter n=1 Tax=Actinocrinis puniceicyclus TaxID=977794 RepID=A0A8J8BEQ6_9ACTN|nr:MATE family efflux transporter [Actinocrinis puniceicyclus]MBS2965815.1 MATE family efflux transporter [Actinocrinis puniceicyclus]
MARTATTTAEFPTGQVTAGEILRLAVPALGALIAEPLFLLADTAIISRLGTAPLAGLGTAAAALATLVNVCVFLAYGTTATVARRLGAGDTAGALNSGIAGVALAAGLGVTLALVGLGAAEPIVRWLGVPPASIGYAGTYLRISSLGLPCMLIVLAGTGVLRGLADTRTPLLIAGWGAVANAALNYLLVYPAGMGIAGSALGTVLTQTAMAAAYLRIIHTAARARGVRPLPRLEEVRHGLGANAALLIRTVALRAYLLVGVWVAGRLGTTALGAHTVGSNVWNLLAMALDALAIAAQALVGHALGAGRPDRARQLLSRLTRWGVGYGLVTGGLLLAVSPFALSLMTPDAHVRAALVPVVLIMALFQPVAGAVFVLDGVLIGAGDSRYLAWAGLACTAVFVGAALPVALAPLTLTYLWWAVGALMLARLFALGVRAKGAKWIEAGPG